MSTPHINANPGDFAPTVLMPGDPLRAQYIAENFLEDVRKVTDVRNMFGFTGTYKGKPVSIMGSGMGIPSMSIYARELIVSYDVKNLIRIGTCGGIGSDIKIRDVLKRYWQCTTIQIDFNNPERFELKFVGDDGKSHRPIMIHRALLGSLERFFGILIEQYGGH